MHEIELFNDRLINMIYACHKPSAKFTTTKKFITFSFALSWKLIYDFPASRADHNSPSPITKALSHLAINCILVKSPATSTQKFIEKFTHQQPTEQIELPFHPQSNSTLLSHLMAVPLFRTKLDYKFQLQQHQFSAAGLVATTPLCR